MKIMKFKQEMNEKGSLIYMSVLSFGILFLFLVILNDRIVSNRSDVEHRIKLDGLALNISEAGLFETLAQFKEQGSMSHKLDTSTEAQLNHVNFNFTWTCKNVAQGCTKVLDEPFSFDINDPGAFIDHTNDNCEICDTAGRTQKGFYIPHSEEPKIGVVRNFDVMGKVAEFDPVTGEALNELGDLKVRYEVWERMVEDYSKETGYDSQDSGRVWVARSVGLVYTVTEEEGQNVVNTLSTVVQTRMYKKPNINFPDDSPLFNTNVMGHVQLNANAQVINLGDPLTVTSAYYGKQTNLGAAHQGANIVDFKDNGEPFESTLEMTFESVFGLDKTQMKEFADNYIIDTSDPLAYEPLMDTEIRYIEGDMNYTTSDPLFGNGLLIVEGNIDISGTGHKFEGILWCTGEVDIHAGGYIKGTIIAGTEYSGKVELSVQGANSNNWFYVYFDPEAIAAINGKKFKYAMFRVPYVRKGVAAVALSEDEKNLRTQLILEKYEE